MSQHKRGLFLIAFYSVDDSEWTLIVIVHMPFVTIVDVRLGGFVDSWSLMMGGFPLVYHVTCSSGEEFLEAILITIIDEHV